LKESQSSPKNIKSLWIIISKRAICRAYPNQNKAGNRKYFFPIMRFEKGTILTEKYDPIRHLNETNWRLFLQRLLHSWSDNTRRHSASPPNISQARIHVGGRHKTDVPPNSCRIQNRCLPEGSLATLKEYAPGRVSARFRYLWDSISSLLKDESIGEIRRIFVKSRRSKKRYPKFVLCRRHVNRIEYKKRYYRPNERGNLNPKQI
jgi:hypothetical protein